MGVYNIVTQTNLQSGQPEDVSVVLANFQAIAAILNGGIDNSNVNAAAAIAASKLAGYPTDAAKILQGDGAWASRAPGLFSVSKSANQAGIVSLTSTKITWQTEAIDVDGWFDLGNSRYIPQVSGWYFLTTHIAAISFLYPVGTRIIVDIFKNNAIYRRLSSMRLGSQADDWNTGGSALVQANGTTDYFEIFLNHNGGANGSVDGSGITTYFSGHLVAKV